MSTLFHRVRDLSLDILHDRRGAIAILFGLALIPILVLAGGVIDYSKSVRVQSRLQQVCPGRRRCRTKSNGSDSPSGDQKSFLNRYTLCTSPCRMQQLRRNEPP